jgi:hypothetical protein
MNIESDCCGASPWLNNEDLGICGACKEHCEFLYDFDDLPENAQRAAIEDNRIINTDMGMDEGEDLESDEAVAETLRNHRFTLNGEIR